MLLSIDKHKLCSTISRKNSLSPRGERKEEDEEAVVAAPQATPEVAKTINLRSEPEIQDDVIVQMNFKDESEDKKAV